MKYKINRNHILAFFLIVILLVMVSYTNHKEKIRKDNLPPTLAYHIGCQSAKIDQAVLDLHKNTSLIGAYIEFDKLPYDKETEKFIEENNIYIYEGSQLFEISPKLIARIPTESLCDLVNLKSVQYISMPNNIEAQ